MGFTKKHEDFVKEPMGNKPVTALPGIADVLGAALSNGGFPTVPTMSFTKKHEEFVNEPMGNKPVTALPGIADVLGKALSQGGFPTAYSVLGQYLSLGKDEDKFKQFLRGYGADRGQQQACFDALKCWCDNFL